MNAQPKTALFVAGCGIGDILRASPLIRVLSGLGFKVDLLLAPAYRETVELFKDAPEVRRLYYVPLRRGGRQYDARLMRAKIAGLDRSIYDVAAITQLCLSVNPGLRRLFRARKVYEFTPWLIREDAMSVRHVARILGWEKPIPSPIAMPSKHKFKLQPNTVAIHPGCKPDWLFKRWHSFAELAAHLPNVVVIGTAEELAGTTWPSHVKILPLGLRDTAALLQQCALLVSNDSGLFHLGAAMGTPTLGIFGPTNPARQAMPLPNVFTVTKGLPCEPQCRKTHPYGRSSCEYDLECMRTLTVAEILEAIRKSFGDSLLNPRAHASTENPREFADARSKVTISRHPWRRQISPIK